MKKSFLKGASIFLASVLTVGMCSAYSVNAKAKFSLPKKTTLSYDKKDNGGNGFYTNVIYIKGTNRSNSESILRNGMKVKSSNRKVISTKTFATVYKGNIIKNLIMDCQSYTKYRPNETTGGIFVSWRRKEELPTGA